MEKNFQNREKTFIIKKKNLESTKIFQSQKKNYEIEKKITESRKKKLKSRKIFRNREKNSLHYSFIACARLVTVNHVLHKMCLNLEVNIISVLYVDIKQGLT